MELLAPNSTEVGRRLALLCSISEGENAAFTWFKDGQILDPSVRVAISNSDASSTLSIKHVEVTDTGHYVCVVSNGFSENRIGATLTVRGELCK